MGTTPMTPQELECRTPSEVIAEQDKPKPRRRVTIQGKHVLVDGWDGVMRLPPRKKGVVITEFSPSARRRLLKRIAIVRWPEMQGGWFVTLTYPDEVMVYDSKVATMHRSWLTRNVEAYCKEKIPCLWRKEYTPRLSGPRVGQSLHHWHISIFTDKEIPVSTIAGWWKGMLKWRWEIQVHRKRMKGSQHAAFYLAKYMVKPPPCSILEYTPNLNSIGRAWGWTRWGLVPKYSRSRTDNIDDDRWDEIIAACRRAWNSPDGEVMESFSFLGPAAERLAEEIKSILS